MTHTTAAAPDPYWIRRANRRILSSYLRSRYATGRVTLSDRRLATLLDLLPGHRGDADATVFGLTPVPGGRILEVGCGDGSKLDWLVAGKE